MASTYYLVITESSQKYQWELEVLAFNLSLLGSPPLICLLYGEDREFGDYLAKNYNNVAVYHYQDDRPSRLYPSSVRPWLWAKFLKGNPKYQKDRFFYIDSDLVFSYLPKLDDLKTTPKRWCGTYTGNVAHPKRLGNYLGKKTHQILGKLLGMTEAELFDFDPRTVIGGQFLIDSPQPEFWLEMYKRCEQVYEILDKSNLPTELYPLKWWTDMWCMMWLCRKFRIETYADHSLDYVTPERSILELKTKAILHNTVMADGDVSKKKLTTDIFIKNQWREKSPIGVDHFVNPNKASAFYVSMIDELAKFKQAKHEE